VTIPSNNDNTKCIVLIYHHVVSILSILPGLLPLYDGRLQDIRQQEIMAEAPPMITVEMKYLYNRVNKWMKITLLVYCEYSHSLYSLGGTTKLKGHLFREAWMWHFDIWYTSPWKNTYLLTYLLTYHVLDSIWCNYCNAVTAKSVRAKP